MNFLKSSTLLAEGRTLPASSTTTGTRTGSSSPASQRRSKMPAPSAINAHEDDRRLTRPSPGGGLRSKGADSQSRRLAQKQNAPGTAVTAPRAKHPREDTHGCTRTYPQSRQSVNTGDRAFPHLQPQRVCRGHVLDQKPVSRRQDGGTSRKMGVMKHF